VLRGGNGTPPVALPFDCLARIEALLESIEQGLAVQFQRIADIQAQLDRAVADVRLRPSGRAGDLGLPPSRLFLLLSRGY
jgi:hypothetical protein